MNSDQDVVITGVGVVSPLGIGVEPFWDALLRGDSGVSVREAFVDTQSPIRIAAPVTGFDARQFVKPRKALKIMCEPIQFGCAAASMAIQQAGLEAGEERELSPDRIGTVFGTETFFADPNEVADVFRECTEGNDYQHDRWGEFAMREIQPLWMLKYLPNMAASHISIAMDARGPSNSICQGEASSLLALIEAADLIRRGDADVVVTGGTGSQMALTAMLYRGVAGLSKQIDNPTTASRPFDKNRDGMVVGEGAGCLVLESAAGAKQRGAEILANISGWSRGYALPGSPQATTALQAALIDTLKMADHSAADVGFVNANASGSVLGDASEAAAISAVFGNTPVVAHKSNFGNLGPGTSVIELIGGLQSLQHGVIPKTLNFQEQCPSCPVNALTENTQLESNSFAKTSVSATGQIATVLLTK